MNNKRVMFDNDLVGVRALGCLFCSLRIEHVAGCTARRSIKIHDDLLNFIFLGQPQYLCAVTVIFIFSPVPAKRLTRFYLALEKNKKKIFFFCWSSCSTLCTLYKMYYNTRHYCTVMINNNYTLYIVLYMWCTCVRCTYV